MQEVTHFHFQDQSVRVIFDESGDPQWLANDVCKILGYGNPRDAINKHCRKKGVVKHDTLTDGGYQKITYIDEGNLYRLIIKSKKPQSEPFESWVCDEVLPAIRKDGYYCHSEQDLNPAPATSGVTPITVSRLSECAQGVKAAMIMARAFGYKNEQARTLANEVVREITGIDALSLLNAPDTTDERLPLLDAPSPDDWLEQQMLGDFIEQCCITTETARISSKRLYDHFVVWFEQHNPYNVDTPSHVNFSRRMGRHFRKLKSTGIMYYIGLTVQENREVTA
jgi:prophage antirepressor-like protein